MIETDTAQFVTAIIFVTAMITLVVGMYGYHLVVSGKRLREAGRLATAAIEFTPAFMTIVFDRQGRVMVLDVRDNASRQHFRSAFMSKKISDMSFLPTGLQPLRENKQIPDGKSQKKPTAPLKMPDGRVLYLEWEMQDFGDKNDKSALRIARGYDVTTELIFTQEKLKASSAISSEAEERERKRIAEDLHDRIGEILMTSSMILNDLKKNNPLPEMSRGLDELDGTIDKFTRATRSLILDLVPPVLYDVGLAAAVEAYAEDFAKRHDVVVEVEDHLQDIHINQEISIFLYKAVRECIMNARTHGGADEVRISLTHPDHALEVVVEDNGSGFADTANEMKVSTDSGFGLFNVRNRAEYYRGGIEIAVSANLGGGRIRIWVPYLAQ